MKIFKTAVKAILVFDAAYLCFVCAEDVCSRIRSRMKKKNKTEPKPCFFDDEEEEFEPYKVEADTDAFEPSLSIDAIRHLFRSEVHDFVRNELLPSGKDTLAALTIGFSQLSVTEFFVFRKMESHETESHLLCGWSSKCL